MGEICHGKRNQTVSSGHNPRGDIVVKSARGRMYSVKKAADLVFSCEDLFKYVETELYATIDTEAETWECILIEID